MLVDAHCHLDQIDTPEDALQEAQRLGVERVVAVSMEGGSMARVLALKRAAPQQVLAGLGIHPMLVPDAADDDLDAWYRYAEAHIHEADVIGEIGLDFKYATTPDQQKRQYDVLKRMLALADKARLPINLHSRRALRPTLDVAADFTRSTGLGAQLHWFTHSIKLVRDSNAARVYVSVGPSLLESDSACAVAAAVDPGLLLLETDTPVEYAHGVARPAWTAQVAQVVGRLWHCDAAEVARRTTANFEHYLKAGSR